MAAAAESAKAATLNNAQDVLLRDASACFSGSWKEIIFTKKSGPEIEQLLLKLDLRVPWYHQKASQIAPCSKTIGLDVARSRWREQTTASTGTDFTRVCKLDASQHLKELPDGALLRRSAWLQRDADGHTCVISHTTFLRNARLRGVEGGQPPTAHSHSHSDQAAVRLRLELSRASGLPKGDAKASDPYVVVGCSGSRGDPQKYRSRTKRKTLAPVWNEQFEFSAQTVEAARDVLLTFKVFDADVGLDNLLCTGTLQLGNTAAFRSLGLSEFVTVPLVPKRAGLADGGQLRVRVTVMREVKHHAVMRVVRDGGKELLMRSQYTLRGVPEETVHADRVFVRVTTKPRLSPAASLAGFFAGGGRG